MKDPAAAFTVPGIRLGGIAVIPVLLTLLACEQPPNGTFDLLIRGAVVVDGAGEEPFRGDVGIRDGRIVLVGDAADAPAHRTLDAEGLHVAPGFIDLHSHAAPGLATPELSQGRPLLAQGITTVVVNPDGGGPIDLHGQRTELLEDGLGVNVAQLVPHGSIREAIMGLENRPPTGQELEGMGVLVREGMEQGAFGLSTGLFYVPGNYAETEELVELARIAAEHGGVYHSHVRDEGGYSVGVVASVEEVIRIAREADLPGIVTHIKAFGPREWGLSGDLIQIMEEARERGVSVWADQYPYEAAGGSISGILMPRWALAGGREAALERLDDPDESSRIRDGIATSLEREGGADRIQFRRVEHSPGLEGRTLAQVAEDWDIEPVEVAVRLYRQGGASFVTFAMQEDDIEALMRQPWTMTSSDGGLVPLGEGVPHPRNYGAFPRKLHRYVLEREIIDLPFAIRNMTSLSAEVMGIPGRGTVEAGAVADLVVFDLERVRDRATYQDPHQLAEGMVHVLVGGVPLMEDGEFTDALPGDVLRR